MKLFETLQKRGFIQQTTEGVDKLLSEEKVTLYHGIDPTADSAHVGHFAVWMLLRHLRDAGHRVIFLVGGGTGMIGDPKPDAERELRTVEEIDKNVAALKSQAETVVGGGGEVTFVNNADWLRSLPLIEFLRDIGKHFTVNELLKKEAIARRVEGEEGISYTEFAYPLLQGYDYLELFRRYGCTLQVGGSDQWGNVLAGVDLVRRKERTAVHALTVPLVVDAATGKKFGKSEGNAVWLDKEKTSPYQFYQFWLNSSDESVGDFLRLFTLLPLEEVDEILRAHETNPGLRTAQHRLATEVTTLVHKEEAALAAAKVSKTLFGDSKVSELSEEEKSILLDNAPAYKLADTTPLVDVLVATGMATSKREARTFVVDGAVTLDGEKCDDVEMECVSTNELRLLKRGKKQLVVLHK